MKRISLVLAIGAALLLAAVPAVADAPIATPGPASNVWSDTAVLNGGVDPGGENLTECQFTYAPDPTLTIGAQTANCETYPSGNTSTGVYAVLGGLIPNTTYYYVLTAANASGSSTTPMRSFMTSNTPPPAPAATTDPATDVTSTSATLNATVDADNVAVVSCDFEYGTTTSYGQSTPCSPVTTTSQSQSVTADLSGLTPQQTYHFEVVFKTKGGTTDGGDQQFTAADQGGSTTTTTTPTTTTPTPAPTGVTKAASRITTKSAVLHAVVNLEGGTLTSCAFQYGRLVSADGTTTISRSRSVSCSPAPGGSSDVAVSAAVARLSGSTRYGFRVVVATSGGTASGSILSFETKLPRPGVRITKTKISWKRRTVTFTFKWTGVRAKRYQCALVSRKRGKFGKPHFAKCHSRKTYRKLQKRHYEFLVRAGNAAGYGAPRKRRFRIA